jgi:hypothetical protein
MRITLHNQVPVAVDARTLDLIAQAAQVQLREHLAPAWHLSPGDDVVLGDTGDGGDLLVQLVNEDPDPSGTLGEVLAYHMERPDGTRPAPVLVQRILRGGGQLLLGPRGISMETLHEILEGRIDGCCNLWADEVALEPCDPVEPLGSEDCYFIDVGGAKVAAPNFVFPSYFDPHGRPPYDFLHRLSAPLSLLPGGYQIQRDPAGALCRLGAEPPPWRTHYRSRTARRRTRS